MIMFKREFEIYLKNNEKLKELLEGGKPFIQFSEDEFYSKPFSIDEPLDFKLPGNYPNCCEFHKNIPPYIENWFNRFPNCCIRHKAYINTAWFKKENYLNVPEKIRNQLLFTEYFIKAHIEDVDWYEKITNYIEYNILSFGSPEIGGDRYLIILEHYVRNASIEKSKINDYKKKQITEYFELLKEAKNRHKTDLNILYSIFQKWVKSIPTVGRFQVIKEQVVNKFPIRLILYNGEYNPFLGETKFRIRTKSELIKILIDITKNTLLLISSEERYDEMAGEYSNSYIKVLKESHRMKQNQLLLEYSKGERKYIKIIKQWLKNEKQFLFNISQLTSLKIDNKLFSNFPDITQKVIENDLEGALKDLIEKCKSSNEKNLLIQVYHQLSRLDDIEKRRRSGIVSQDDYSLEVNRIRLAILELIDLIK